MFFVNNYERDMADMVVFDVYYAMFCKQNHLKMSILLNEQEYKIMFGFMI